VYRPVKNRATPDFWRCYASRTKALRHKVNFVILEDVPIGVCDKCGARYFDASVLRRVANVGRGSAATQRTIEVPVDRYAPA